MILGRESGIMLDFVSFVLDYGGFLEMDRIRRQIGLDLVNSF